MLITVFLNLINNGNNSTTMTNNKKNEAKENKNKGQLPKLTGIQSYKLISKKKMIFKQFVGDFTYDFK